MDGIHIRKATTEDLPVLRQFEQGVIEAERPFDETLQRSSIRYYDLEGMLEQENVHLVVALAGNEPVGCGYARIEAAKPYLRHRQYAYLGFMYVVPRYRGHGINRQVMAVLEAWAAEKGITECRLEVYLHNEAALRAYQKIGFSGLLLEMRKSIPRP